MIAAVALAACSTATPLAAPVKPPTPVTVVLVAPEPAPTRAVVTVAPKAVPKPVVKPRPVVKVLHVKIHQAPVHVAAEPTHFVCHIGQPCNPPAKYWTKTVGCTVAWRKAMNTTVCPPGWPPIP